MKIHIMTLEGIASGECTLDAQIFSQSNRPDVLARVVRWQRAKRQAGTHSSKGISDISGTTRKPYKQKGTGNARHGSRRSPQFRGGAVIFGPQPRSHAHALPKRVRRLGLSVALSALHRQNRLTIVDKISVASPQASQFSKVMRALKLSKPLFVTATSVEKNFSRACSNWPCVDVLPVEGLNVYDILSHNNLVMEKDVLAVLEKRFK